MSNDYMDTVRTYAVETLHVSADEISAVLEQVRSLNVSTYRIPQCTDARVVELLLVLRGTDIIDINPSLLTPRMCLLAIKNSPWMLRHIDPDIAGDLYPEICLCAIKYSYLQFAYVSPAVQAAHPELCVAAVKENGNALQFVETHTPELIRLALESNGCAIQHVQDQTPELCLLAVQKASHALELVRNQTPEIRAAAEQRARHEMGYRLFPRI